MVILAIGGIEVDFPYEPYGVQKQYMARVIASLRSGSNACLESPTGTGKSLALLCSTLAWREAYVAALQIHANGGRDEKLFKSVGLSPQSVEGRGISVVVEAKSNDSATAERDSPSVVTKEGEKGSEMIQALVGLVKPGAGPVALRAPRIIFSSRTHSQLAQAIGELKSTVYRPYMTVLGSRDQLCVNDISRRYSGSRLNGACRSLTGANRRGCRYHLPVMSPRDHENRSKTLLEQLRDEPPKDIEDLGEFGIRESACPYFLTRTAVSSGEVEVLFLPYNFLIHKATRDSLDLDWANDVVIVDEAHNLESICSDAVSFDLTPAVRQACQKELLQCITKAANSGGVQFPALKEMAATEAGADLVAGSELADVSEIKDLLKMLKQVDNAIDTLPITRPAEKSGDIVGSAQFVAHPGSFMRELLVEAGCVGENVEALLEVLERAMEDWGGTGDRDVNTALGDGSESRSSSTPLRILHSALRTLFDPTIAKYESCFKTVVQAANPEAPSAGRTISYWCFNPAVAMSEIVSLRLRSLIVTSGTLSPMDSFASELGVDFPVRLENRHVIGCEQVKGAVICSGPDGFRLSSNFRIRETDEYKLSLGRTILELAKIIPDGVLVFFPSYKAMNSCIEFWRAVGVGAHGQKPSISELLQQYKQMIIEPRDAANFKAAILSHQNKIRDGTHGSILFAVCRGKVSEGIDFSDAYGRAVIMAGIPYPAAFDPKVTLKKQYMDTHMSGVRENGLDARVKGCQILNGGDSSEKTLPAKGISGEDWYTLQALRAVNQAIGRAVRHKDDYGIVVLCDERFSSVHLQSQLSRWVRPYMSVYATSKDASTAATDFFTRVKEMPFALRASAKLRKRRIETALSGVDAAVASSSRRGRIQGDDDIDAQIANARETIAKFLPPRRTEEEMQREFLRMTEGFEFALNPSSSAPREAAESVEGGRLLDLLGARPRGDQYGSTSLQKANKEASQPMMTMSAKFVEQNDFGENSKSSPPATNPRRRKSSAGDHSSSLPPKRQKLSDAAKALFDDQEHFRSTFSALRRILALAKEVGEGEGPLQTGSQRESAMKAGNEEVENLVRCIRFKCGAKISSAEVASFLATLRPKIPLQFTVAYDAAIADTRGVK